MTAWTFRAAGSCCAPATWTAACGSTVMCRAWLSAAKISFLWQNGLICAAVATDSVSETPSSDE